MSAAIRVLFVTPELAPLVKIGGLADVSAALPPALRARGVDVRLLVPGYPPVLEVPRLRCVRAALPILPGLAPCRLLRGRVPDTDLPLYVLDSEALYAREGEPYQDAAGEDWPDNWRRFGALSRAAALIGTSASPARWRADAVHCNDWQTGLAPAYLAFDPRRRARTVMTVHNLAFPGGFPAERVPDLDLPWDGYRMHGFEFYGRLSFLKAGLYYADHLSTVSRGYAEEIQTPALGGGFDGLLAARREHLTGILNGIDTRTWDPASDEHLAVRYDAGSLERKAENKAALQARLGLAREPAVPLVGMVTRLTFQKGVDLLAPALVLLSQRRFQLAVLGSGERAMEAELARLAAASPRAASFTRAFDEGLAHQIEAGADLFLMPSRFEPCGLNQMYSMRYGTPPVVRRTGGLADTVTDTTPETLRAETATGFVFDDPVPAALAACLARAFDAYAATGVWRRLQRNGMRGEFGWERSAAQYELLYRRVTGRPAAR